MRASEYPKSGQKEKDRGPGKTGTYPTAHEQSRIFPFFDAFLSDEVGRKGRYTFEKVGTYQFVFKVWKPNGQLAGKAVTRTVVVTE